MDADTLTLILGVAVALSGWLVFFLQRAELQDKRLDTRVHALIGERIIAITELSDRAKSVIDEARAAAAEVKDTASESERSVNAIAVQMKAELQSGLITLQDARTQAEAVVNELRVRAKQAEAEANEISRVHESALEHEILEAEAIQVLRDLGFNMEFEELGRPKGLDFVARLDRPSAPSFYLGVEIKRLPKRSAANVVTAATIQARSVVDSGRVDAYFVVTDRQLVPSEAIEVPDIYVIPLEQLAYMVQLVIAQSDERNAATDEPDKS